jgi:allophanate hydrolase subunit 2
MGSLVVRAEIDVEIATDREPARVVRAGETYKADSALARVTYLTVRGGIDAPLVLGGRGTLLVAHLGRALRAVRERSRPMVRGAIEVPADGAPIVLGPEHPTTGGYPILGVVTSEDLGRLFSIRLGGIVRFAVV